MLYRKRGKAMMDMKFSPDWLRRVAKEEEDVRFSVGGWTSGIIRPGGEDHQCMAERFLSLLFSMTYNVFHRNTKISTGTRWQPTCYNVFSGKYQEDRSVTEMSKVSRAQAGIQAVAPRGRN
jgi:hypothetical protein